MRFEVIDEVEVASYPAATVYESGWQSWSPAGAYPASLECSPRPLRDVWQTMAFRPELRAPAAGFQGEGLLAFSPDGVDGPTRTWAAPHPDTSVPSIRARLVRGRLVISADGPVIELPVAPHLDQALSSAADQFAASVGPRPLRSIGPGWCSWYGYVHDVTDAVVAENVAIIDTAGLDVRVIQIDDGYQANIGDWLGSSGRIADLAALARRILDGGRQAGIWTAPFMVGADSRLAQEHPEWLVRDALAAHHWGQQVAVLDVTHPGAAAHLGQVFRTLRAWGFSFYKIDFLYAGAMVGGRYGDAAPIAAYREGLRIIREAVGDDAVILGCGAPLLASIGLVDAMRVSPDTDHRLEPVDGDLSQPSIRGALTAGRARSWMHGRLWVNDPDCIVATPRSEDREVWAAHVAAYGGLALSGDRLVELDGRGLELTRALLKPSSAEPLRWLPHAGPDGGRIEPSGLVPG